VIVTIDGPAGAGKSSAALALARRLGFRFLDTGAMYRAVALAAMRRRLDWNDPDEVARLVESLAIDLDETRLLLDGEDVTTAIRASDVTVATRQAADHPVVRRRLVELQRLAVGSADFVAEGRDQGTVVFPDAQCKIFLTATPLERARRRHRDLTASGESITLDEVLAQQNSRDTADSMRPVGPLRAAADAVEVVTDGLTCDDVVDRLMAIVVAKMHGPSDGPIN
jgi:cytidylate kinase